MSDVQDREAMPLVSVVITTYNRKSFVDEAIESVLAQTYANYELIVVDDGSTDGTPEYIEERYGDRLKVLRRENGGPGAARNSGAEAAKGELLAFLDDDDMFNPEKLGMQVALFRKEGEGLGIAGGGAQFVSKGGEPTGNPQLGRTEVRYRDCCVKPNIPGIGSCMMVRRSVWLEMGGMDEGLRRAQDMDLLIRVSRKYRVVNVPQVLVRVRVHDGVRPNVDLSTIIQCREVILGRIDDPLLRRRARAWFYFTLFRRLWLAGDRMQAIGWWLRSFLAWPLPTGGGAQRIRGTGRVVLP